MLGEASLCGNYTLQTVLQRTIVEKRQLIENAFYRCMHHVGHEYEKRYVATTLLNPKQLIT